MMRWWGQGVFIEYFVFTNVFVMIDVGEDLIEKFDIMYGSY